jgi:YHS domain-containing protein
MMAVQGKRKSRICPAIVFGTLAGALIGCWTGIIQLSAATTERVVTDYHTGLAISGFDPVAYFTESRAISGRAELETRYAGAGWRFINEGNRAAFIADPEVYMPVFGGYDPVGVARGVAVSGHPEIWLIVGKQLYLFHNHQTRKSFADEPDKFIAAAYRQWPKVESTLSK